MTLALNTLLSRIAVLTALMVGLGLCAAVVCGLAAGSDGIEAAAWACVLCLVPGWLVLACEPLVRSPGQMITMVLLGTGVRVGLAALGAVYLLAVRPSLPREPFLFSLLVMYLASLAWETWILKRSLMLAGDGSAGSVS